MFKLTLAAAALAIATSGATAQGRFTRQQQEAACSDDAMALCRDAVPDEQKVKTCMITKRKQLSERCSSILEGSLPPKR